MPRPHAFETHVCCPKMSRPLNRSHRAHSGGPGSGENSVSAEGPRPGAALRAPSTSPAPASPHRSGPGALPSPAAVPLPGTAPEARPAAARGVRRAGPRLRSAAHPRSSSGGRSASPAPHPAGSPAPPRRSSGVYAAGRAPVVTWKAGQAPAPSPPRPRPRRHATLPCPRPAALEPGHRAGEGPGFLTREPQGLGHEPLTLDWALTRGVEAAPVM